MEFDLYLAVARTRMDMRALKVVMIPSVMDMACSSGLGP